MDEVTYRLATPDDAEALCAVARECFLDTFGHLYRPHDLAGFLRDTYSPALQRAQIEDPQQRHQFAFDAAGKLIGFIGAGTLKLPVEAPITPCIELRRLYIVRAWHGRGVAQELMRWCFDEAKAAGAVAMYLGVWRYNERAQRFYARYGFRKVGEYLFAVGEHRDEEDILELRLG